MPVIALSVTAVLVVTIFILVVILVAFEVRRRQDQRHGADQPSPRQSAPAAETEKERARPQSPQPAGAAPPSTAYLQLVGTERAPLRYPLKTALVTIGRDASCTIHVDEGVASVSRRHAQIERDGEDYILTDLNSENGLFVNGARVGRNLLCDGAIISLAQVVSFTFHANPGGKTS
ncbi:MAG: FHA domain-containing protein [Caldilineaceae bacterium]|jgi:pSer/pThr/pTyr-binding forkhead associated (FHA) protein|nr:FHA domain-containing protein [Caldilineaceae bacterium]